MPEINGTENGEYLAGTDSDDVIRGFGGNDQISAFHGNDLIYPGAGKDYVQAGVGDDTIILADPMEYADFFPMRVYEEFNGGIGFDTIEMQNFANSALNITNGYGLVSNYALNVAWGFQGIERLAFSSSTDVGVYATIQHVQVETSTVTHVVGGAGRDILVIYATYSARFDMPAFTVTNWQPAPADLSSGDVIAMMATTTDMVLLTAREGLGATQALFGNNGDDTLTGSSSADRLDGGAGNDTLIGNGGADLISGGLGNDVYFVDSAGDTVIEAAEGGTDRIVALASFALSAGAEIETLETNGYTGTGAIDLTGSDTANLIIGNNGLNTLFGGGGDDTIHGFAGADYLFGGTGFDNLYGGAGDDAFYIASADGDRIWELAGEGYDTVSTEVDYELPDTAAVERLEAGTLWATTALYLGGSNLNNLIIGNAGNNTLRGYAGNDTLHGLADNDTLIGDEGDDTMHGGAGDDVYFVNAAGDVVDEVAGEGSDRVASSVSYALLADASIEILETNHLAGTAAIDLTGSDFDNTIYGNDGVNELNGRSGSDRLWGLGGNDRLIGGEGDDTLIGGAGNDVLIGEQGDDIYFIDAGTDAVVELAGQGHDRLVAVDYTLVADAEVELLESPNFASTFRVRLGGSDTANLIHGAAGDDVLSGNGGDDMLNGYGGSDLLIGGVGADVMSGHGGNDTYYVDNPLDQVFEDAGNGVDRIGTSVSYALIGSSEVERIETITLSASDPINLKGSDYANSLGGNEGANVLDGGLGNDLFRGAGGADTFAFTTALGSNNVDQMEDFVSGQDLIGLDDAIFTAIAPGALQAGAFWTGSQANDADDRIIYDQTTGSLFYDPDGTGAAAQMQFATLAGAPPLTGSDFVLI